MMNHANNDLGAVLYVVRCEIAHADVAKQWRRWLCDTHMADVVVAGALSAELLCEDESPWVFEVHYRFKDRQAFNRYETEQAPRLREEGLSLFPLALGLTYQRRVMDLITRSF